MNKLSILIPSYNEPYLNKTVRDILNKAKGEIEIFVNIDGDRPKRLVKDKRVSYFHHQKPIGMRAGANLGLKHATGKYVMKVDSHCMFARGFDEAMKRDCEENWLMIPRRYSLNTANWSRLLDRPIRDYHYYAYPTRKSWLGMPCPEWLSMTRRRMNDPKYEIDDTMSFQGSCWFAHRKYFMKRVGYLDDSETTYTPYSGEQLEVGLKYWLNGGEVKINKRTWYAHLFKTGNYYKKNKLDREFKASALTWRGHRWAAKHWMNNEEPGMKHKFAWLVEKFWPVPDWPEDRSLWKL
jgi:glycosyltransferase involved in cell wall biosynthesis